MMKNGLEQHPVDKNRGNVSPRLTPGCVGMRHLFCDGRGLRGLKAVLPRGMWRNRQKFLLNFYQSYKSVDKPVARTFIFYLLI